MTQDAAPTLGSAGETDVCVFFVSLLFFLWGIFMFYFFLAVFSWRVCAGPAGCLLELLQAFPVSVAVGRLVSTRAPGKGDTGKAAAHRPARGGREGGTARRDDQVLTGRWLSRCSSRALLRFFFEGLVPLLT